MTLVLSATRLLNLVSSNAEKLMFTLLLALRKVRVERHVDKPPWVHLQRVRDVPLVLDQGLAVYSIVDGQVHVGTEVEGRLSPASAERHCVSNIRFRLCLWRDVGVGLARSSRV